MITMHFFHLSKNSIDNKRLWNINSVNIGNEGLFIRFENLVTDFILLRRHDFEGK